MTKNIYLGKSRLEVERNEDLGIHLETDVWDRFYSKIKSKKKKVPFIWKIFIHYYGAEGNFLIKSKDIGKLRDETSGLINEYKFNSNEKDIIEFFKNLLSYCDIAIKNKSNMYGIAD